MSPPSRVRHDLYLGNAYNAVNFWELRSLDVSHVLNLCAEERFDPPEASYAEAGIECHRIRLTDQPSQDILPVLEEALAFVRASRAAGGVCVVHCEYGVSRSATIVIASVMSDERLSLRKALESVKSVRTQVQRRRAACWR